MQLTLPSCSYRHGLSGRETGAPTLNSVSHGVSAYLRPHKLRCAVTARLRVAANPHRRSDSAGGLIARNGGRWSNGTGEAGGLGCRIGGGCSALRRGDEPGGNGVFVSASGAGESEGRTKVVHLRASANGGVQASVNNS